MKIFNYEISKKEILHWFWKLFLVIFGTFVLAIGSGLFLVPFQIVSGGLTGIGILLSSFIPVDITAYILTWSLFVLGLIFLGFHFSLTTLVSTIIYPVILSILLRTSIAENFVRFVLSNYENVIWNANGYIENLIELNIDQGLVLIFGIIGGACVGIGCALTFLGGGSTGGLDILAFLINKFTGLRTSLVVFALDGSIVAIGLIVNLAQGNSFAFVSGLTGIISAFICSLVIEVLYTGKEKAYMVDIITDKTDEFLKFSIEKLDRTITIFEVVGGYSSEKKKMVRLTFNRREYILVKDAIAQIDPNAFATFSQTILVGGEGFTKLKKSDENIVKNLENFIKNKKNGRK